MITRQFYRILIIDDDYVAGYLSQITIKDMAIAEDVIHLQSVDSAISYIKDHCSAHQAAKHDCPDIILLDINMPIKDGFDFLDELKQMGQQALINAKVLALTSSSAVRDKDKMEKYGVKGFIEKPITQSNLLQAAQKLGTSE